MEKVCLHYLEHDKWLTQLLSKPAVSLPNSGLSDLRVSHVGSGCASPTRTMKTQCSHATCTFNHQCCSLDFDNKGLNGLL
jgi:hypothetical protein